VKGKPEPWAVGGLCFRVQHDDGRMYDGRAAGMDDQLRRELWERPEEFVGRVVELVHWGIQDAGALRFPQVRRLRSPADKPAPNKPGESGTRTAKRVRHATSAAVASAELKASSTPRMRNYAAMRDPKLLDCIDSLRSRSGEAFQKCVNSGGDPAEHLTAAEHAAREKNLL
jgi:hypothetical protein